MQCSNTMKSLNLVSEMATDLRCNPFVFATIEIITLRLCSFYLCKDLLGRTAFNLSTSVTTAIYRSKLKTHVPQINYGKPFKLIGLFDVVCASHSLTPSAISLLVISTNLLTLGEMMHLCISRQWHCPRTGADILPSHQSPKAKAVFTHHQIPARQSLPFPISVCWFLSRNRQRFNKAAKQDCPSVLFFS